MKQMLIAAAVSAAALGSAPALAQGLPGGATSLSETFGDWVLTCVAPEAGKRCVISHTRVNSQSRQRVLAIELARGPEGAASGVMVLPFGLRLGSGVSLAPETGAPLTLDFSTCLPAGCIVRLDLDPAQIARLAEAGTATLAAVADDDGSQITLPVSFSGFAGAFARLADLEG